MMKMDLAMSALEVRIIIVTLVEVVEVGVEAGAAEEGEEAAIAVVNEATLYASLASSERV